MAKKKDFKDRVKEKFGWDVTALPAYVDEQSDEILTDLVFSSGLTSRIQVMENVKGSKTIKLLDADMDLNEVSGCVLADDGSITFDGKDMVTKRLGVRQSLCNEDLEDTWAQLLLEIGANRQDQTLPAEDVITAYLIKKSKKKNQDLMFLGDTGSGNTNLVHYDGFVKLWDADGSLATGTLAGQGTTITDTNAFAAAKKVYEAIDDVLFDNGVEVEIITGRTEAQAIIDNVWNDKDFNANIDDIVRTDSELSFTLPTTGIKVRSYPQLTGLNKMYAVPYRYMFFGTDLESDVDGLEIKWLEEAEKIRMQNKWRSGVQYVLETYFAKLVLTA